MPGRSHNALFEIAQDQYGYVTVEDAHAVGVRTINLVRMAERGTLERVATGLYRFASWPVSQYDQLMEATLWPRGVRGVISHATALDLYKLSDVNPAKVHVTVPRAHRVRREVPALYVLHHEDLDPAAVTRWEGIPVVKPVTAIRQGRDAHLGPRLIGQAVEDGLRSGLLTRADVERLRGEEVAAVS